MPRNPKRIFTGTHLLFAIIDASWKVNAYYREFVCVGEIVLYADPLPLPLDTKYHIFCFLIKNKVEFAESAFRFDLHKLSMLPLTDNRNPCNPWTFQLVVYKCDR